MEDEKQLSRRRFLNLAWIGSVLLVLAEGAGILFAFLRPKRQRKQIVQVPVAHVDDIPLDGAVINREEEVLLTRPSGGIRPFAELAKTASQRRIKGKDMATSDVVDDLDQTAKESGIVALSIVCTHLACKIKKWNPEAGRLECACHGGAFNLQGEVVAGPPPRPLDRLNFHIEEEKIVVEKERRIA